MSYDPNAIEPKWQQHWRETRAFRTPPIDDRPKFYVLDMLPYPSGAGLHVGHVEGYTASDIVARFMRMRGYNVLHPMGWDAFGLPAEQYAIETGTHPAKSTAANVTTFRQQCDLLGLSYDWEREIDTSDPGYYRWTQWIFLKMLERDLAYRAEATVNWCPALGTVLANDEVVDGKSERGGHPVIRKPMMQWMLRITAYADRLLAGLEKIDFPESIKVMQRDRIGRSEGTDVLFGVAGMDEKLEVFTTRPDTLFGATFCVLAPEHPLVGRLTAPEQRAAVEAYIAEASARTDLARTGPDSGKTGVFTGAYAINPVTEQKIPILVADYVLATYGTGAIMCVPGHDRRDWAFARRFELPIVEVVSGGDVTKEAYEGDGVHVNSGFLDGLDKRAAVPCANAWLVEKGIGRTRVRYRMRDWIFARQRYWGEPVPVVHGEGGDIHGVPETELPLLLPHLDDFKPTGGEESPLARLPEWVDTQVPGTDRPGRRETHTMPTLAASSWYFFRYIDPVNGEQIFDPDLAKRWMPVDLYIGGAEHAVGHLLYSRFWTMFLYDIGLSPVEEPFAKLVNQGMILGEDSRKMSKRYGNVVNPTAVVESHGADALRIYEMFMGPIEASKPWSGDGLNGARRFLDRVWRLFFDDDDALLASIQDVPPTPAMQRLLHRTIDKVARDTEGLRFNTAIAQMMTFVNEVNRMPVRSRGALETFVLLLAPYAPHLAEELWNRLGHGTSVGLARFPEADPALLAVQEVEIAIQVDGKVCGRIVVGVEDPEADVIPRALAESTVTDRLAGKTPKKTIYVPRRLVSISTK